MGTRATPPNCGSGQWPDLISDVRGTQSPAPLEQKKTGAPIRKSHTTSKLPILFAPFFFVRPQKWISAGPLQILRQGNQAFQVIGFLCAEFLHICYATPGLRACVLGARALGYMQMWHQVWVFRPNWDSFEVIVARFLYLGWHCNEAFRLLLDMGYLQ